MTDIFLYQGEAAPSNIKLRDPTVAAMSTTMLIGIGIASAEAFGAGSVAAGLQPPYRSPAGSVVGGKKPRRRPLIWWSEAPTYVSPQAQAPASTVLTGAGIASAEAFGHATAYSRLQLAAKGISTAARFGRGRIVQTQDEEIILLLAA